MQNNSFTLFYPIAGYVAGKVTVSGGTPSLGSLTGTNAIQRALVTIADNGTGDFTISVQDFYGQRGIVLGGGNGKVLGTIVNPQDGSYSGNTASVRFLISDAAAGASDTDFNFWMLAF